MRNPHKLLQREHSVVYNNGFALFQAFKDRAWQTLQ